MHIETAHEDEYYNVQELEKGRDEDVVQENVSVKNKSNDLYGLFLMKLKYDCNLYQSTLEKINLSVTKVITDLLQFKVFNH